MGLELALALDIITSIVSIFPVVDPTPDPDPEPRLGTEDRTGVIATGVAMKGDVEQEQQS